jgi:hypothetical protein
MSRSIAGCYPDATTPWPESVNELYWPSDCRLSAKLVPTFADRGCHVVKIRWLHQSRKLWMAVCILLSLIHTIWPVLRSSASSASVLTFTTNFELFWLPSRNVALNKARVCSCFSLCGLGRQLRQHRLQQFCYWCVTQPLLFCLSFAGCCLATAVT